MILKRKTELYFINVWFLSRPFTFVVFFFYLIHRCFLICLSFAFPSQKCMNSFESIFWMHHNIFSIFLLIAWITLSFSNINLFKSMSVCCRLSWNSNVLGKFARNCQEYVSNEHQSKFKRSTTNMIFMCDLILTFIFLFIFFFEQHCALSLCIHIHKRYICIWFSSFYAILWGEIRVCVCKYQKWRCHNRWMMASKWTHRNKSIARFAKKNYNPQN